MKDEAYRAECRRQARERFDAEYGSEAPSPPLADDDYATVQGARAEWERSPALRAEFTSLEAYTAFKKAEAKGLVRIISRKP